MFAPLFTECAIAVGAIEAGSMTSSISGGCNIITFFLAKSVEFMGSAPGLIVTGVVTVAVVVFNGIRIRRLHAAQTGEAGK